MSEGATQRPPGIDRRVVAAIAAVVVVALIAVIVWAVSAGGDDDDTATDSTTVTTGSSSESSSELSSGDATTTEPATSAPSPSPSSTNASDDTAATSPTEPGTSAPAGTGSPVPTTPPPTSGAPATAPVTAPATEPPVEVSLDDDADLGGGVEVAITQIESVEGEAQGVGERSGPSLRLTVALTNGTDAEIATDLALVNLYYGEDLTPATPLSGPGVESFPQTAAPGETVTGRLVFLVPEEERGHIVVEFSYSTEAPKAVFTGPVG